MAEGGDATRAAQARAAVRGVLALQAGANLAGAAIVLAYLSLLFPVDVGDGDRLQALNLVVFGAYLLLTLIVAAPLNAWRLRRSVSWVRDGRPPTDAERLDTFTLPLQQTVSAFVGWLGAAIIFGLLNDDAARVSVGIGLAGLVTCSILYLLLERHFRPLFALALVGRHLPEGRREILPRLMLAWLLGSAVPLLAIGVAPLTVPDDQQDQILQDWQVAVLVITALVAGGAVMRAAAGSVSAPILRVREAMRRVEGGDLDVHVPVDNLGEVGRLAAGFNAMADGLRERAELFELLDRQVGPEVARHSLAQRPSLGGTSRHVTVLFVDLHGYTTFAERHTPEQVVDMLNRFFGVVVKVVTAAGGHVNKFEGDAALCVFGAPEDQPDHALRALRAAAGLPTAFATLPEGPHAGIGVATGDAVAGYVGTPDRYEYTVIGDVVNVAARLCDIAKDRPASVLAAAETVAAAGAGARSDDAWRAAGSVQLRGRTAETPVFEPVDAPPTPPTLRPQVSPVARP